MEIGLGLVVGVAVGVVLGLLATAAVAALGKGKAAPRPTAAAAEPPPGGPLERRTADRGARAAEMLGRRERELGKSVFAVRNLVARLGDIVTRTDNASGATAEAFISAKNNLAAANLDDPQAIVSAHAAALAEIDRVMKANDGLRAELSGAKKGIAEQRKQIEALKNALRVDSLTQLPNRAAFDERLHEFVDRRDRSGDTFSLLMLDIDFFKQVNDTYGHPSGDRILKGIALKIHENVRANDFAARYGGEEFAVLLPGATFAEAKRVADRLCRDIEKAVFKLDGVDVKITISGGLAEAARGMTAEDMVAAADKVLYAAKNGGRNQIRCAIENPS